MRSVLTLASAAILIASNASAYDNGMSSQTNMNAQDNYRQSSVNAPAAQTGDQSDTAVATKIRDALKGGLFSKGYDYITVDVNGGVVTLSGSVPSESDHKKVLDKVQKVDGTHRILDHIQVSSK